MGEQPFCLTPPTNRGAVVSWISSTARNTVYEGSHRDIVPFGKMEKGPEKLEFPPGHSFHSG